ncbi:hypothetical protein D3C72_1362190 [compost metagenome]
MPRSARPRANRALLRSSLPITGPTDSNELTLNSPSLALRSAKSVLRSASDMLLVRMMAVFSSAMVTWASVWPDSAMRSLIWVAVTGLLKVKSIRPPPVKSMPSFTGVPKVIMEMTMAMRPGSNRRPEMPNQRFLRDMKSKSEFSILLAMVRPSYRIFEGICTPNRVPPSVRSCRASSTWCMSVRVAVIAVNIETITPMASVRAKPLTRPVPK